MRINRSATSVALPLFLIACGQGDNGNVMAPAGNALSPEQVDSALGPELDGPALAGPGSAAEEATEGNTAEAVEAAQAVEETAAPEPAAEPEPEEPEEPTAEAEPVTQDNQAEE